MQGICQRSQLKQRLRYIACNDKPAKLSTRVKAGDSIKGVLSAPTCVDIVPEDIPLCVLYEDENCLVIDKAQGMVVHPGAGNFRGTLLHALMWRYQEDVFFAEAEGYDPAVTVRPGIVHRLDKDTSGYHDYCKKCRDTCFFCGAVCCTAGKETVYCSNQWACARWGAYYSPCAGIHVTVVRFTVSPKHEPVWVSNYEKARRVMKSCTAKDAGRISCTAIKTVRYMGKHCSMVVLQPYTGRTHQLRVHMQYLQAGIAGDMLYGSVKSKRENTGALMLHALSLTIRIPIGKRRAAVFSGKEQSSVNRQFRANVPHRFIRFLAQNE